MQIGSWSIDSLKVRIPLSRVQILDESINEIIARVSERTGEVLESKENTKASRDEKGIKTTLALNREQPSLTQYLISLSWSMQSNLAQSILKVSQHTT